MVDSKLCPSLKEAKPGVSKHQNHKMDAFVMCPGDNFPFKSLLLKFFTSVFFISRGEKKSRTNGQGMKKD